MYMPSGRQTVAGIMGTLRQVPIALRETEEITEMYH